MRPNSIIRFERIYLISLFLVLVQTLASFFFFQSMFSGLTGGSAPPPGFSETFSAVMIGATFVGIAMSVGVPLLFWWLAARKRQEFARWLLLVISVLSVLNWMFSSFILVALPAELMMAPGAANFRSMQLVVLVADAVAEVLGIIALTYLFRSDSTAWFRGANPVASADVFR
jgi:hypothetical protein